MTVQDHSDADHELFAKTNADLFRSLREKEAVSHEDAAAAADTVSNQDFAATMRALRSAINADARLPNRLRSVLGIPSAGSASAYEVAQHLMQWRMPTATINSLDWYPPEFRGAHKKYGGHTSVPLSPVWQQLADFGIGKSFDAKAKFECAGCGRKYNIVATIEHMLGAPGSLPKADLCKGCLGAMGVQCSGASNANVTTALSALASMRKATMRIGAFRDEFSGEWHCARRAPDQIGAVAHQIHWDFTHQKKGLLLVMCDPGDVRGLSRDNRWPGLHDVKNQFVKIGRLTPKMADTYRWLLESLEKLDRAIALLDEIEGAAAACVENGEGCDPTRIDQVLKFQEVENAKAEASD